MPTPALPPMKPLTSWSYSRYTDYKKCPAFFKYKHRMGMKEPGSLAMQRGTDIHGLAENYTKGLLPKLPQELALFKDEFKTLKAQKIKYVEDTWTWTKDWERETTFNDWSGAWLRVKLDVAYLNTQHNALVPIDFKTGKYNNWKLDGYKEQLELYGLGGLLKFPDVDVVSPRLWYLDAGVIYPSGEPDQPEIEYFRDDLEPLKKTWLMKIEPMFKDNKLDPIPSKECSWCHFRASNGGPCKY